MLQLCGKRLTRPATFSAIGVVNTTLDYAAYWALITVAGLSPVLANVISFSLGGANSFMMNSFSTFRDRGIAIGSGGRIGRFVIVTLLCLMVSSATVALLVRIMDPLGAKAVSILFTFAVGYVLNSRVVFRAEPRPVSDIGK
jgi:putative flippase GtrA